MDDPIVQAGIGVVVIGRNEGERLRRCLKSVSDFTDQLIYVDSGSTDDSVAIARELGADVVDLDLSMPFTAARARNAGVHRLLELTGPAVEFVQMVDGDCEIVDGWFEAATAFLSERKDAAIVCGRLHERYPEASVYNRLCDLEWKELSERALSCGGNALIRIKALREVGFYDGSLIAGEEPELCFRLRGGGWTVHSLDCAMVLHDAHMTRFGQWWKRSMRTGYAYAEGVAMHGRSAERYFVREVRSAIAWAIVLPAVAFLLARFTHGASLILLSGYMVLYRRVRRDRLGFGDALDHATLYAKYAVLGKFAEFAGMIRYWVNSSLGRRARIIEYKGIAK